MAKRVSHSDNLAKDRAKGLYDYCKNRKTCNDCPFDREDEYGGDCKINYPDINWDLEEVKNNE